MSGEDKASRSASPGSQRAASNNPFDPATLFGSPAAMAGSPYAHLAHMTGAYGLLGHHPFMAPPFGGLGSLAGDSLANPLSSPGALGQSPLSPSTGGDWWRSVSEEARRAVVDRPVPHDLLTAPNTVSHSLYGYSALDALYGDKSLNGAYSSMFQLPTLSTTASSTPSSTSTKSSSSSKTSSTSSKSHNSSSSSASNKNSQRVSNSSSHNSNDQHHSNSNSLNNSKHRSQDEHSLSQKREKESSSRSSQSKERDRDRERPSSTSSRSSTDTLPPSSSSSPYAQDFWKSMGMPNPNDLADPAKYAASLYQYGGLPSSAAASLYATQSLFGAGMYPFAASMYGMPSFPPPGFPPGYPHPMTSADLGSLSPHSTSSKASSASATSKTKTTTTQSTTTTPTASVSKAGSNSHYKTSSSSHHNSSSTERSHHDRKSAGSSESSSSRKKLFDSHTSASTLPVNNKDIPKSADTPPALTPHKPHGAAIPAQSNRAHLKSGGRSDSEFSSDSSQSDVSDSEEDKTFSKHTIASLSSSPTLSHRSTESPSMRSQAHTSTFKRPPDPELVQDLSVKKRTNSGGSDGSDTSRRLASPMGIGHNDMSKVLATDAPLDLTAPTTGKSKSSRSSASKGSRTATSSSATPSSEAATSAAEMAAAAASQQMAELFGFPYASQFNPLTAAALMPGMFDPATAHAMMMMMPPPPSSSEVATTRGKGRGRGRGASGSGRRGRNCNSAKAMASDETMHGVADKGVTTGSKRGRKPTRGRGSDRGRKGTQHMVSLLSQQNILEKQQRQREDELQKQFEDSLREQHNALKLAKKAEMESQKNIQSKLAMALMGQNAEVPTKAEDPLVAKLKNMNKAGSESASGVESSDSDEDSDDSSSSSEESNSEGNDSGQESEDPDQDKDDGAPRKKRKLNLDEAEIRIPLEHGWQRQTRIRGIGTRGFVGEVVYFAPCGKKLKSVPEVARYLDKNGITDLTRDNFTYSLRINVGEFLENSIVSPENADGSRSSRPHQSYRTLSEEEVVERFVAIATKKKAKLVAREQKAKKKLQRKKEAEEMARQMAEMKMQKKMEQQEIAHRIAEMKMKRRLERQAARETARKAKQMKLIEMKKMKEHERIMRQQEKLQRQEQMRVEREMRAQQMIEEREMKRQHQVIMKEQERERRRQHMMLVKALEARKKQEEREKTREEKRLKLVKEREQKLEQRRMEDQVQEELRRPVEDMMLKDHQELPEYKHVQGVRLAGSAFADALMVVEFLHTFGSALDLDPDSLPNLEELQSALLDTDVEDDDVDQLMNLTTNLLRIALNDPGFPNPRKAVTTTGEKIMDVELTDHNCSEVLRIFIKARNSKENEITETLRRRPMQSMNPTQKAAILAFLCNELLTSKAVSAEIEGHLETVQNLRRDKWVTESKMRKLRMVRAKRIRKDAETKRNAEATAAKEQDEGSTTGTPSRRASDDEEEHESGNDSDVTNATGNVSDCEEDEGMTNEDLQKKIDKLGKQQETMQKKSFDTGHKLRALELGQDRFRRRYWVLPHCGGVFVEGLESAELPADLKAEDVILGNEISDSKTKVKKEKGVKEETIVKEEQTNGNCNMEEEKAQVKVEQNEEKVMNGDVRKVEKMEIDENKCDIDMKKNTKLNSAFSNENLKNGETTTNGNSGKNDSSTSDNSSLLTTANKLENNAISLLKKEVTNVRKSEEMNGSICGAIEEQKFAKGAMVNATEKMDSSIAQKSESLPLVNGNPGHSAFKVPDGSTNSPHLKLDGSYSELFNNISKHESHNKTLNNLSPIVNKVEQHKEPSFRSIDSMLGTDSGKNSLNSSPACVTSSTSALFGSDFFMPGMMSSSTPMSAEQMLKSFSQRASQSDVVNKDTGTKGSWFSVLPRMPCDESSITRCPSAGSALAQNSLNMSANSTLDLSQSRASDFSIASLSQSSLNVNNSMNQSGFGMHPSNPSVAMTTSMTTSTIQTMTNSLLNNVQYSQPVPIPLEKQRGWWRISDPEQLKLAHKNLHQRGMREKWLHETLCRHLDYSSASCTRNKKFTHIRISDESKAIAASAVGAPEPDDPTYWIPYVAHASETVVLEEVENMEERVYTASLQVKKLRQSGWKLPPKVTEDDDLELVGPEVNSEDMKENQRRTLEVARERLLALEKNVERRYLKPPFTKLVKLNLENIKSGHGTSTRPATPGQSGNNTPLHNEDSNLSGAAEQDEDPEDDEEEEEQTNLPAALVRWRRAVGEAVSAAQLLLCAMQLNRAIAWEKSIMKVQCIICTKDDNEAQLLLCDSCDKGYHMYCFKPKMTGVPDGNWYCFECISKATGESVCVRCGKKANKLVVCDHCPRAMHLDCMEPTLNRMPRKWACWMCQLRQLKKNKKKKCKDETISDSDISHPGTPIAADKQRKNSCGENSSPEAKEVGKRRLSFDTTDMTPCKQLMSELEKHDEAWPFLLPVNVKQFPTYRKVIKHPMDFQTMKAKLRDNSYKTHQDFASDARLVFNNCQTFNEDDSAVGRAGHTMRDFFEERFVELCAGHN